jgi:hypothetical protein
VDLASASNKRLMLRRALASAGAFLRSGFYITCHPLSPIKSRKVFKVDRLSPDLGWESSKSLIRRDLDLQSIHKFRFMTFESN